MLEDSSTRSFPPLVRRTDLEIGHSVPCSSQRDHFSVSISTHSLTNSRGDKRVRIHSRSSWWPASEMLKSVLAPICLRTVYSLISCSSILLSQVSCHSSSEPVTTNERPAEVSVKVSTSIVEPADVPHLPLSPGAQWRPIVETSLPSEVAGLRQHRSTGGLPSANTQFSNQDAIVGGYPTRYNGQRTHHQKQQFQEIPPAQPRQAAGKIINLQPASASQENSYRRSVSTSWNILPAPQQETPASGNPTQAPRQSQVIEQPKSNVADFAGSQVAPDPEGRGWGDLGNLLQFGANKVAPQRQQGCSKRSLARVLRHAKSFLTGGFSVIERSATPGNLMLGSSILAAAIPLVAFLMPDTSLTRTLGLSNMDKMSLQGRVESLMGWVERSIEHLPSFPRLHPQECVKRSICEAHNDPNKYGAIGFTLRLLFPASNLSSTDRMDDMEFKVINKYRHAAGYGVSHRVDANATDTGDRQSSSACKEKYEDCLVNFLDVARNLLDVLTK